MFSEGSDIRASLPFLSYFRGFPVFEHFKHCLDLFTGLWWEAGG